LRVFHLIELGVDACSAGEDLQVAAGDGEDDELARVLRVQLRGIGAGAGGAKIVERCEIEKIGLRVAHQGVIVKGTNDGGKRSAQGAERSKCGGAQAFRLQIDFGTGFAGADAEFGKEFATASVSESGIEPAAAADLSGTLPSKGLCT